MAVNLDPTKLVGNINGKAIINGVGWLIAGVIVIGCIAWFTYWYYTRKQWNKTITRFEIVGDRYEPIFRDKAKIVKIGKGGFEVLYYKKAKVYRIAFGERIGKNHYYMFMAPDGYEYNGYLGKQITTDGRIPIITTNPSMRAQYTALEKYIDLLHGNKPGFWDKYGNWVLTIGFVVIIGAFAYLFFQQYQNIIKQVPELLKNSADLIDKINKLLVAADSHGQTASLTPAP